MKKEDITDGITTEKRDMQVKESAELSSSDLDVLKRRIADLEHALAVRESGFCAGLVAFFRRISAPVRRAREDKGSLLHGFDAAARSGWRLSARLMRRMIQWSLRQPRVKGAAVAVLTRIPMLERKVRVMIAPSAGVSYSAVTNIPPARQTAHCTIAIVSRDPSAAEVLVEGAFQRALARSR